MPFTARKNLKNYVSFLDLETTGFNGSLDEVLSFCLIVDHDGHTVEQLEGVCRCEGWSKDAEKIHGISREESNQGMSQDAFARCMLSNLKKYPGKIVCHSKKIGWTFDVGFVLGACFWHGYRSSFYKAFEKIKEDSTHRIAKEKGFKKLGLASLCKELNIELKHHDASSDALACRQVYYRLDEEWI